MAVCHAPGCGAQATRYGHFCTTHKSRIRRHGDIGQAGVTKAALKPYAVTAQQRIEKNAGSPLWEQCDARWLALVEHSRGLITAYERGRPGNRYEQRAAHEVERLASAVQPRAVVEAVAAMYLLRDCEPRRFRSDAAFNAQLVRRVRGLSEVNAGEWFDHNAGRVKRVYRDVPPTVTAILAKWLNETLGAVGIKLAELERKERDEAVAKLDAFRMALEDLT